MSKQTPLDRMKAQLKSLPRWIGYGLGALVTLIVIWLAVSLMLGGGDSGSSRSAANDPWGMGQMGGDMGAVGNPMRALTFMSLIAGLALGSGLVLLFAFWRFLITRYGWVLVLGGAVVTVLIGSLSSDPGVIGFTSLIAFYLGLIAGLSIAASFFVTVQPPMDLPNVFGSSRWATLDDLKHWSLLGKREDGDGLFLGEALGESSEAVIYRGDMHALTVAPTRTGKGATAIIPNLLRSRGSILVIDPKGENARRSAAKRKAMGQRVHIIDPWGIASEPDQYGEGADPSLRAQFNPLDALDPDDPDLASDAMMLAESLVLASDKDQKDPFWSDEAKALLYGFILHVITAPEEEGNRNLGRVRDILCLPPAGTEPDAPLAGTMDEVLMHMAASDHPLVRSSAFRLAQKAEKERAGVISSAQSNTHFLDSPLIRESLSTSDLRFADLKTASEGATVYLVLPLDRLTTFNRWLRLLITSALIDLTRTPANPDSQEPVRVILDEFAALDRLKAVETAYGTMAGLGVQLWVITQDLAQLMRLYGDKAWQTFVSNSGVLQYFGSRDYETAKYAEHLTGMTTLKKRSISFGTSSSGTSSAQGASSTSGSSENISYDDVQRPLAYADEMMTLHRDLQVLFIENRYPILARKHWWFREQIDKS